MRRALGTRVDTHSPCGHAFRVGASRSVRARVCTPQWARLALAHMSCRRTPPLGAPRVGTRPCGYVLCVATDTLRPLTASATLAASPVPGDRHPFPRFPGRLLLLPPRHCP